MNRLIIALVILAIIAALVAYVGLRSPANHPAASNTSKTMTHAPVRRGGAKEY